MRPVLVVVVLALVVARLLGLFTVGFVTTGSMEPTLPAGSVFVGVAIPVEAGDMVVFRLADGTRVVHRAVEPAGEGWITKGDANGDIDQTGGRPLAHPYAVIPEFGGVPLALRQAWLKPLGLVVAETALVTIGLKGFLEERRAAGRRDVVRPHHLALAAAAVALATAPFLHQELQAEGALTVGASVLPMMVRVEDDAGVSIHEIAPFSSTTVDVKGDVDIVRSPSLPGARALSEYGAVAASLPVALVMLGLAGTLRWAGC